MKVSVIIPVYNAERYLRKCLDSVLNQTLRDIEIICVDDSSTDDSLKILNEYAVRDSRVRVITQENGGAGKARNTGMDAASGEFLSFLDADDFFETSMLEEAWKKAVSDWDDLVVFGSDQYFEEVPEGEKKKGSFVRKNWVIRLSEIPPFQPFSFRQMTDNVFKVFVGWAWDKLFRTSFVKKHGLRFQEQRSSNDMLFVFSAIVLAERISVLPDVYAHQRRDAADSVSKTREKSWDCFYSALMALRDRLREAGLYEELEQDYINYALHFSLWNYDTLAEPTKSMLRDKLCTEWFKELGISGKPGSWFYNKKEYAHYLDIIGSVSEAATLTEPSPGKDRTGAVPKAAVSTLKELTAKDKKGKAGAGHPVKWLRRKLTGNISDEIADIQAELKKQDKQLKEISHKIYTVHLRNCDFHAEERKQIYDLKTYIGRELERRDGWGKTAEEHRRRAGGRKIWTVLCPAPDDESKVRWGDYPFALSLAKNLEREGYYVIVLLREDWNCEQVSDVTIVLRGAAFYRPDRRNSHCKYIMWNISHPDWVTDAEYELYDAVCVGSRHYASVLTERLSVPVYALLQCTDTDLFYPAAESENSRDAYRYQYVFIGNSRGIARSSVMWAIEDDLPLTIWGSGWDTILAGHLNVIADSHIENAQIPDLYRNAKVTINDHWKDMLEKQYVNNRIFDALACGLPVITDTCPELKEIFPDAVLHYSDRMEFEKCVRRIDEDYDAVRASVLSVQELIRREYSFEARARQLTEIVGMFDS